MVVYPFRVLAGGAIPLTLSSVAGDGYTTTLEQAVTVTLPAGVPTPDPASSAQTPPEGDLSLPASTAPTPALQLAATGGAGAIRLVLAAFRALTGRRLRRRLRAQPAATLRRFVVVAAQRGTGARGDGRVKIRMLREVASGDSDAALAKAA